MFLISTAIITGIGQLFLYRSQRETTLNQLKLEDTKASLERAH